MAKLLDWLFPIKNQGYRDFLFGTSDTFTKLENGTPEQQALHNQGINNTIQMGQQGGGYDLANQYNNKLLNPNSQDAFDEFSSPYMQQFRDKILPMIAERFAGGGALSSSGFAQTVGGAGADLQSNLAKMFSDLQSQAAQQQYGQYNQGNQTALNYKPFDYKQKAGSGGVLPSLLTGAGAALGGPVGGAIGQGISSGISSLYKNSRGGGIT